jgi:hypothetical protein
MVLKEAPLTAVQHGQYMPVPEQFESWTQDLMTLPQRTAYVKLHTDPAVKVRTLGVPDPRPHQSDIDLVLSMYRKRYQRTRVEAEAAMAETHQPEPASSIVPNVPFTLFSPSEKEKVVWSR